MESYIGLVSGFERFFDGLGMMKGNNARSKRFVFGALVGGILVTWLKPASMFSKDGSAKTWAFLADPEEESAMVPWWLVPTISGIFSGIFI
jgi:hypothetical protein